MPLILPKRQVQLGTQLSIKPKQREEQIDARFMIPVVGYSLSFDEFDDIMLDPKASKSFYKFTKDRPPVPRWPNMAPLTLFPVHGFNTTLFLSRRQMKLTDVSLVKNHITLTESGPIWSFQIPCIPDITEAIESLVSLIGQKFNIEMECEHYGSQQTLGLEGDEDDKDGDEDEDEPSPTGKKIAAAAAKKDKAAT